MKKSIQISIAQIAFYIEEDAYKILDNYLQEIEKRISDSTLKKEILFDVESRMVELFEKDKKKIPYVLTSEDIQKVISIIGKPDEIYQDETGSTKSQDTENNHFARKLYRNPNDKVIGGVISGICNYFGIKDATVPRIIIVLLIIFGLGSPVIIYLVCWIIIPQAQSPSEIAQMKGERVSLSSIEKHASEFSKKLQEKVKKAQVSSKIEEGFKIVLKVFSAIFLIFTLGILFVATAIFLGLYKFSNPLFNPIFDFFFMNYNDIRILNITLFILFLIPISWILYYLLITILNGKRRRFLWLKIFSGIIWFIGLMIIINMTVHYALQFKSENKYAETIEFEKSKDTLLILVKKSNQNQTLYLDSLDWEDDLDVDENHKIFKLDFLGEKIYSKLEENDFDKIAIKNVELSIYPTANKKYSIEKKVYSHGRTSKEAIKNAQFVNYSMSLSKGQGKNSCDTLFLDEFFSIDKNNKWRNQKAKINIGIPDNTIILFKSKGNTHVNIYSTEKKWVNKEDAKKYYSLKNSQLFTKGDNIYCESCIED